MKKFKSIVLKNPQLRNLRKNLRAVLREGIYIEWEKKLDLLEGYRINRLGACRENWYIEEEVEQLKQLLYNSIIFCNNHYCQNWLENDKVYVPKIKKWFCVECYSRYKEMNDNEYYFNKGVIVQEDAHKPCLYLGWCPYGHIVEAFMKGDTSVRTQCKTFNHDCPAFYVAEAVNEKSKEVPVPNPKLRDNLKNISFFIENKINHRMGFYKPCRTLHWCPYGSLGDAFQRKKDNKKIMCKIYPHNCPVFYNAQVFIDDYSLWSDEEKEMMKEEDNLFDSLCDGSINKDLSFKGLGSPLRHIRDRLTKKIWQSNLDTMDYNMDMNEDMGIERFINGNIDDRDGLLFSGCLDKLSLEELQDLIDQSRIKLRSLAELQPYIDDGKLDELEEIELLYFSKLRKIKVINFNLELVKNVFTLFEESCLEPFIWNNKNFQKEVIFPLIKDILTNNNIKEHFINDMKKRLYFPDNFYEGEGVQTVFLILSIIIQNSNFNDLKSLLEKDIIELLKKIKKEFNSFIYDYHQDFFRLWKNFFISYNNYLNYFNEINEKCSLK